jgi:hypothetical protein
MMKIVLVMIPHEFCDMRGWTAHSGRVHQVLPMLAASI